MGEIVSWSGACIGLLGRSRISNILMKKLDNGFNNLPANMLSCQSNVSNCLNYFSRILYRSIIRALFNLYLDAQFTFENRRREPEAVNSAFHSRGPNALLLSYIEHHAVIWSKNCKVKMKNTFDINFCGNWWKNENKHKS